MRPLDKSQLRRLCQPRVTPEEDQAALQPLIPSQCLGTAESDRDYYYLKTSGQLNTN